MGSSIVEILRAEGRPGTGHAAAPEGTLTWADDTLVWTQPDGSTCQWGVDSVQRLQVSRARCWRWPARRWGRLIEPFEEHLLVVECHAEGTRVVFAAATSKEDVRGLPVINVAELARVSRDTLVALLEHMRFMDIEAARWDRADTEIPDASSPNLEAVSVPFRWRWVLGGGVGVAMFVVLLTGYSINANALRNASHYKQPWFEMLAEELRFFFMPSHWVWLCAVILSIVGVLSCRRVAVASDRLGSHWIVYWGWPMALYHRAFRRDGPVRVGPTTPARK